MGVNASMISELERLNRPPHTSSDADSKVGLNLPEGMTYYDIGTASSSQYSAGNPTKYGWKNGWPSDADSLHLVGTTSQPFGDDFKIVPLTKLIRPAEGNSLSVAFESDAYTSIHFLYRKRDGSGWYITSDLKKLGTPLWMIFLIIGAVLLVIIVSVVFCCICCCRSKQPQAPVQPQYA